MKSLYRLLGSLLKGVAVAGINTTSWGFYYQPETPKKLVK